MSKRDEFYHNSSFAREFIYKGWILPWLAYPHKLGIMMKVSLKVKHFLEKTACSGEQDEDIRRFRRRARVVTLQ